MSDLISRQDALKPFCIAPDGTRIPEVDCDNFPVEFSVEFIKKHLLSLPSADRPTEWMGRMNRYKKELDHEKQITAIMCMVCPDHRLMRWKIEKLLRHGYPTEKIVKIVKGYCQGGEE